MPIPAVENIKATMKFKYENLQWKQHESLTENMNLDIFTNFDQVQSFCGGGNDLESVNCWLDAYNYSLMNKLPVTEDIYNFITHRAYIMRQGFKDEFARISEHGFNEGVLTHFWNSFLETGASVLNFIMVHGLEVLNIILGGIV